VPIHVLNRDKDMRQITAVKSEKHKKHIIWVIMLLAPIVGMAVDLIAPSLPAIAKGLDASATMAKNVITIYLLGYAIGNFVAGFLTDAYGRKRLLRSATFGFFLASFLPVLFPNEQMLLLARAFQGLFLGAQMVVCRATLSDILTAKELKSMGVLMGTMWGLGPVIGPVLGGYLQYYFDWQAGFVFFSLVSFVMLIAVVRIVPETHTRPVPLRIATIKTNMIEVLKHRTFMGLVLLMGLVYSLIIIFNTLGPFLIQQQLHFSPAYFGRFALMLGCAFLVATIICRRLLKNICGKRLVFLSLHVFLGLGVVALIASYLFPLNIYFVGIASAAVFFLAGFIFPLSMGQGMAMFQHVAGTAAAVMYLINISITTLASLVSSFFNIQSAVPLLYIYVALQVLAVVVYWLMIRGGLKEAGK
jgi:MFS transporter, DHA1 family, multidrug resistance protein